MSYQFVYRHWVPAKQRVAGFPFNYILKALETEPQEFIEIDYLIGTGPNEAEKQRDMIKEYLIHYFDFFKYLDEDSPDFIGNTPNENVKYNIKLNRYRMIKEGKKNVKQVVNTFYLQATNFSSEYSFTLVKSLDHLKEIVKDATKLSFDTETTGLDPEVDVIVGLSISTQPSKGYYAPLAHAEEFSDMNLDTVEALNIVYNSMLKADRTYMFNARFDCRVLEYSPAKLDMLKPKVIDAQLNAHFADPEYRNHGLKDLEKHFLGYYRPDLNDTLKAYGTNTYNFSLINPKLGLFYAAQDAISTFELGEVTYQYQKEFGISGELDQTLWPILMRYENNAMGVDTKFIQEQLNIILPRLEELDKEIVVLETKKEKLTAILSNADSSSDDLNEASKKLGELIPVLEEKTDRWMELAEYV